MKKFLSLLLCFILVTPAFAAGKIQDADVKSEAELITAGATKAQLINASKIYTTANGINDTLANAITNGQIGGGSSVGGVNLLFNESAEFGLTGYTNSGGTLTQQTYTNGKTGDTKYLRFVSGTIGQYVETSAYAKPDSLGAGCIADFDAHVTSGSWTYSVIDGSSNVLASGSVFAPDSSSWQKQLPIAMSCPASGITVKLRIASTVIGTIEVDHLYLGGNKNVAQVAQSKLAGDSYFAGTTSCGSWSRGSATIGAFNTDADCPGPTIVYSSLGSWQTTDSDLPRQTINSLPAGVYKATFHGISEVVASSAAVTLAINDGTSTCEGEQGNNSTTGTPNSTVSCVFTYTSSGNRVFELYGASESSTITIDNSRTAPRKSLKFTLEYYPSDAQSALTSDQSGWFIDANIGGANPSLGTAAQASYISIADTALDMIVNTSKGSADAQIGCVSGEAPSGLSCTGAEHISVAWTPPYTGYFDVCFDYSHFINTTGDVNATFQVVETPLSAVTISAEGGARKSSRSTVSGQFAFPYTTCGTFYVSSVTQKLHRLMYEQTTSATVTANTILADRGASNGQRDIKVTVRPSTMNLGRPVLTGDTITASGVNKPVVYEQEVTCGASSTIDAALGTTLFTAIGTQASGNCSFTIASGLFGSTARTNGAPFCKCSTSSDTTTAAVFSMVFSSSTAGTLFCNAGAGACASTVSTICECKGPKP